jgi:low temperature requirement protein LtrA
MSADQSRESDAVSPIELFFDLVFVFALSQLSHHLLVDVTWRGAGETTVMLLAVFSVWAYTTFEATLVHGATSRTWTLLGVMLFGLFMNATISTAFDNSSWAFVIPLLIIQIGRTTWTLATAPQVLREHYIRMLIWLAATAPLWLIGATSEPRARLVWWGAAAIIDLVGMWLAHPLPRHVLRSEEIDFDAAHLVERCRLFLIIALGEAVLTTGIAIADVPIDAMTVLTGTCALIIVVSFWALYFASSDELVDRHVATTSNPILAGRLTLEGESIVLASLIAVAVSNELVIVHPYGDTSPRLSLLLFGGPLLYLAVQTGYEILVLRRRSSTRPIAMGVLVLASGLSLLLPPWASLALVAAILSALVVAVLRESSVIDTTPASL